MSVPQFYNFIDPVLRILADASDPVHRRELIPAAVERMRLTEQELSELAGWKGSSRGVTKANDRAAWAITYANKAGWLNNASRGHWEITTEGRQLLADHPEQIPKHVYKELLAQVREERKRKKAKTEPEEAKPPGGGDEPDEDELSPEEAIRAAYTSLREDIGAVLLSNLRAAEPAFLERTVVELLGAMGYGADDDALEVTGGSGDGGIDGIVRLDKLGLEHIYVQAKRHDPANKVQRKDIQAFFGALTDRNATKGLLITTGGFSSGAREFAKRREGIVLIDGDQLAELMIDHGVGVERGDVIEIVRVDNAFFEDG